MCDKEEKDMGAPSIRPMEARFESEEERQKFIKWADNRQKTNTPEMNKVREGVKRARKMRRSGTFKF